MVTTPNSVHAGDSLTWSVEFPDYPADEWSLSTSLNKPPSDFHLDPFTVLAVGSAFQLSLTTTVSSTLNPGVYTLAYAVSSGTDRCTVHSTSIEVLPDVSAQYDPRSDTEKTLEAVIALLEGKVSDDTQMLQYDGRTLSRYTFTELETLRSRLLRTLAREKARKAGSKGLIGVRF